MANWSNSEIVLYGKVEEIKELTAAAEETITFFVECGADREDLINKYGLYKEVA